MAALNFPDAPSPGQTFVNWQWDGTKWTAAPGLVIANTVDEVPIAFGFPGSPNIGWSVFIPITVPLTLPANFAGSYGFVQAPPAGNVNVNINLRTGANSGAAPPTLLGSVTITPTGMTFATQPGAPFTLPVGSTLQAITTSQDPSLTTISFTLLATRL